MLRCTEVSQPIDAMGHELPRRLAERAAVMPPKAAAPSRDQGGRGGPVATKVQRSNMWTGGPI